MNITIKIDAPELVGAINNLATALGSANPLPMTIVNPPGAGKVEKVKPETPVKETPKEIEKPVKEEPTPIEKANETKEEPAISLEVVRNKLAEFAAGGKPNQEKVKAALTELKAAKLTDVDAADYGKLLELVGLTA